MHTTSSHVYDVTTAGFLAAVVERSQTVPVLVDFWAPWCAPCRALGPILERLAAEYGGAFALAKVDTDREPALATQFQIRSIPTVTLFKDGRSVGGFPGALPEVQIRAFLTRHGVEPGGSAALTLADDPVTRVAQLREAIAAQPTRESLRLELALALLAAGDVDGAAQDLEALPGSFYGDAKAVRARAAVALHRRAATSDGPHAHVITAAIRAVLDGDAAGGINALLALLREDARDAVRDERHPARAALVEVLQCLDDEALVRDARRRMAALLF